jgi:hypothetical protein
MIKIKLKMNQGINERNEFIKQFLSIPNFDNFDIDFVEWLDDNYCSFSLHETIDGNGWFED